MSQWQEIAGRIDALDQRLAGVEGADLVAAEEWVAARQTALGALRDLLERELPEHEQALRLRECLKEISVRQDVLEQRFRLLRAGLREQIARLGRSGYLEHCFAPGTPSPGARMSLRA